jgi:putative membrane protein
MTRVGQAMVASLGIVALALASCTTRRPAPRPAPAVIVPTPPPPPARAASPALFVATAASIDLFVVRACDMALARSGDGRVRALATRLADEHRGLAGQLSLAGRWLDTLPTARLLPREQQRLARLEVQEPFDAAFVRQLSIVHGQSLALHAAFASRGASPTLRPVAANGARVERAHLALLGGR